MSSKKSRYEWMGCFLEENEFQRKRVAKICGASLEL